MNNLINFDDFIEITRDKAEKLKLVEFLQQLGLVSRNFNCPKCRKEMKLSFRNDTADGFYWLCTEKTSVAKKKPQKCRSSVSIRNRTIFAQSKLKIGQILRLIFFGGGSNSSAENRTLRWSFQTNHLQMGRIPPAYYIRLYDD